LYLIDGELLKFWTHFELLHPDDLDRHDLVVLLVDGLVDLAEFSLPHHVVQHVVLDFLTH
jgi:hypothetical protein